MRGGYMETVLKQGTLKNGTQIVLTKEIDNPVWVEANAENPVMVYYQLACEGNFDESFSNHFEELVWERVPLDIKQDLERWRLGSHVVTRPGFVSLHFYTFPSFNAETSLVKFLSDMHELVMRQL